MLSEQVFVMQTVSWANQENGNLTSGDQTQPIHTLPIRKVEQFPTPQEQPSECTVLRLPHPQNQLNRKDS